MFNVPLYLYQGQPLPTPAQLYDYLLARQGLIKRVSNRLVEAELLLAPLPPDLTLPGLKLAPYPLRDARLKVPPLPGELLRQALAIARRDTRNEIMFQMTWQPDAGYELVQPRQTGAGGWVRYHPDPAAQVVLDCHSHHTMPAFFSGQDDRDETGGRFYAVMGRLNLERPHLILRLGLYGHWLPLEPTTLFTDIAPFVPVSGQDRETGILAAEAAPGFLSRFLPWRSAL